MKNLLILIFTFLGLSINAQDATLTMVTSDSTGDTFTLTQKVWKDDNPDDEAALYHIAFEGGETRMTFSVPKDFYYDAEWRKKMVDQGMPYYTIINNAGVDQYYFSDSAKFITYFNLREDDIVDLEFYDSIEDEHGIIEMVVHSLDFEIHE